MAGDGRLVDERIRSMGLESHSGTPAPSASAQGERGGTSRFHASALPLPPTAFAGLSQTPQAGSYPPVGVPPTGTPAVSLADALEGELELEGTAELRLQRAELDHERAKTAELHARVQSLEHTTREQATSLAQLKRDNEALRVRQDLGEAAKATPLSFVQPRAPGSSSNSSSCPPSVFRAAQIARQQAADSAPSVGIDASSTADGGEEGARSSDVNSSWTALQWVGSLQRLSELLTSTLLTPFSSLSGADAKPSSVAQLAYVRAFGGEEVTEEDVVHLLERSPLLRELARLIKFEAHKLTHQKAATAYELNEKFAGIHAATLLAPCGLRSLLATSRAVYRAICSDESTIRSLGWAGDDKSFILSFGGLSTFLEGLSGLIGPPEPNLFAAMSREHTMCDDSTVAFEGARTKLRSGNPAL